ncbi:MAG: ATP-binding protein [Elusimicrobia bacterium]|nr:ATP-binding protein [Elusimicrobiota bacterium]
MTNQQNPFRPGAGHLPPYLAGRDKEQKDFESLLQQKPVLQNVVLTGLRGIGKTVLMESLKPLVAGAKWAWVGTDLSESASISEAAFAERLLTDLAVFGAALKIQTKKVRAIGFNAPTSSGELPLNYQTLRVLFDSTPGLISDKLRAVIELAGSLAVAAGASGIIFAYDEAQTMFDNPDEKQYPLALLLDVFQSVQRKGIQAMLVLTGLPTLFPKLVQARTFAERMFRVIELRPLSQQEAEKAIREPFKSKTVPEEFHFSKSVVELIAATSAGYPYFIQFIGKEVFDVLGAQPDRTKFVVPIHEIVKKLDQEFFAGRWARVTDRQRDLIRVIARLPTANDEFTVQEISEKSRDMKDTIKSFKQSQIVQMLAVLTERGLVYKDRHGKYFFAAPLFADFVNRLGD